MKTQIGVYFIRNKINNKFYVGHSINISKRFLAHKSYLNRGLHHSIYLQRAWDKYGAENFEFGIIKKCSNEKESIELEQYYIDNYSDFLYNTSKEASSGGDLISYHPQKDEIIRKKREKQIEYLATLSKEERITKYGLKGARNGMYGKTHTKEARDIISKARKGSKPAITGMTLDEYYGEDKANEIKQKLSNFAKSRTGEKNSFFGKSHSEESKQLIREKNLGRKPPNMRKVIIDGCIYESLTEASRCLEVVPATILYRIKSKNYPSYKYDDSN